MNCPDGIATDVPEVSGGVDGSVAEALGRLGIDPLPAPLPVNLPSGLPTLPDLPALPVIPALDPTVLLKPITDLLGVFGTGALGGAPGGDPSVAHQQIAQVLEGGVRTLLGAAQTLDGGWLGQAASAAITAVTRTAGESGALAAQGTGMSVDLQAAAAAVAAGALELQGVVAKTAGLLSAALPAIATPPGQAAAVTIVAEGLAEGLAVVSATRAQLLGPTAHMTANGTPVPITAMPGTDGFGTIATVLESALPLVQAGAQAATSLLSGIGAPPNPSTAVTDDPTGGQSLNPAPVPASACPSSCDQSTTTGKAGTSGNSGAPGPTVKAASAVTGAAPASVGVPATAAPAPTPMADCPTTTNASVAAQPSSGTTAVQATATGTGSAIPMAPPTAAASRASDTVRPMTTAPAVSTVPEAPVETEWLSTVTAESLDFDVALALGFGDQDLAGSA